MEETLPGRRRESGFDNKRFAWIRNRVSEKGGIEWIDTTY